VIWCCLDCPAQFEYLTEFRAHGRDTGHELMDVEDDE
jgi:hypothetical protein